MARWGSGVRTHGGTGMYPQNYTQYATAQLRKAERIRGAKKERSERRLTGESSSCRLRNGHGWPFRTNKSVAGSARERPNLHTTPVMLLHVSMPVYSVQS